MIQIQSGRMPSAAAIRQPKPPTPAERAHGITCPNVARWHRYGSVKRQLEALPPGPSARRGVLNVRLRELEGPLFGDASADDNPPVYGPGEPCPVYDARFATRASPLMRALPPLPPITPLDPLEPCPVCKGKAHHEQVAPRCRARSRFHRVLGEPRRGIDRLIDSGPRDRRDERGRFRGWSGAAANPDAVTGRPEPESSRCACPACRTALVLPDHGNGKARAVLSGRDREAVGELWRRHRWLPERSMGRHWGHVFTGKLTSGEVEDAAFDGLADAAMEWVTMGLDGHFPSYARQAMNHAITAAAGRVAGDKDRALDDLERMLAAVAGGETPYWDVEGDERAAVLMSAIMGLSVDDRLYLALHGVPWFAAADLEDLLRTIRDAGSRFVGIDAAAAGRRILALAMGRARSGVPPRPRPIRSIAMATGTSPRTVAARLRRIVEHIAREVGEPINIAV